MLLTQPRQSLACSLSHSLRWNLRSTPSTIVFASIGYEVAAFCCQYARSGQAKPPTALGLPAKAGLRCDLKIITKSLHRAFASQYQKIASNSAENEHLRKRKVEGEPSKDANCEREDRIVGWGMPPHDEQVISGEIDERAEAVGYGKPCPFMKSGTDRGARPLGEGECPIAPPGEGLDEWQCDEPSCCREAGSKSGEEMRPR